MMQDIKSELKKTFQEIKQKAQVLGGEVELLVETGDHFHVATQDGNPEAYESASNFCAGVRVILDGYEGCASTEDKKGIDRAFEEAVENARFTARSRDPNLRSQLVSVEKAGTAPVLPFLANDTLAAVPVADKIERARQLEMTAKQFDSRIQSVPYSGYTEADSEVLLFNSLGVERSQRYTSVTGYSYPLAGEKDDKRMAGESFFVRDAKRTPIKETALQAAERAVSKLGWSQPQTGKYPVVLDGDVVADLLGLIVSDFTGQKVYDKKSLFKEALGTEVASAKLTIVDDPAREDGPHTMPFDGEGCATFKKTLIEKGTLKTFLTNSVFAERLKLPHTCNAVRSPRGPLGESASNLVIEPGQASLQQLLSRYSETLYVTDVAGLHAGYSSGSGDFSFQAEGELWKDGKRVGPINNFVLAGNIKQLLKDVVEVGNRVPTPKGTVISPDLLIRELSVAGKES